MTKVQAKALKVWVVILWTALWCWAYSAGQGQSMELLPVVSGNLLLFCLGGWSCPWGIAGLWRMTQARRRQSSEQLFNKLSAKQLASRRNEPLMVIQQKLIERGYVEVRGGGLYFFTDLGRKVGGEIRKNHPEAHEGHMVWPADIEL